MTEKESKLKYDLEERTVVFAEKIIELLQTIRPTAINQRIISQLVGSSGSVGANYCEAIEAESKKDFIHKISIAKKEIKETNHWLRLLLKAHPEIDKKLEKISQECHELLLIFSKIIISSKKRKL